MKKLTRPLWLGAIMLTCTFQAFAQRAIEGYPEDMPGEIDFAVAVPVYLLAVAASYFFFRKENKSHFEIWLMGLWFQIPIVFILILIY